MAIIGRNAGELSYHDSIAQLRLIKTLGLESGQKRLIQKLHKNITEAFSSSIGGDLLKSLDTAKDILKVPSGELHQLLLKMVCDGFQKLSSLFHM